MTRLLYRGPAPGSGALPLPEGWPAADHDEPDERVASLKIQSGLYAEASADGGHEPERTTPSRRAKQMTEEV